VLIENDRKALVKLAQRHAAGFIPKTEYRQRRSMILDRLHDLDNRRDIGHSQSTASSSCYSKPSLLIASFVFLMMIVLTWGVYRL
jgi:hypothetical protein